MLSSSGSKSTEPGEIGEHLDRLGERLQLVDLGPDVGVQPDQLQVLRFPDSCHRALGEAVGQAEPELGVLLPGLDVGVGRGLDPRGDPQQHPLGAVEQPVGALDLVEGVEDQVTDAGVERVAELGLGLVVAVHVDPLGSHPAGEGHVQLAAGRDVGRQPLLGRKRVHRGRRERLAREQDLEVVGALGERRREPAGALADVVLGVDVGGRAVLGDQVDHVAAAHLEVASIVDARAQRVGGARGDPVELCLPGS